MAICLLIYLLYLCRAVWGKTCEQLYSTESYKMEFKKIDVHEFFYLQFFFCSKLFCKIILELYFPCDS